MSNVVVHTRIPGNVAAILAGHSIVEPPIGASALSSDAFALALADADALLSVVSLRVDAALFDAAPRLRIVANFGVGYDYIDLREAEKRGVIVTNTPDVLTAATADLTLTLILSAARRVREGLDLARSGAWTGWRPDQLLGCDLQGATLGIIGLCRIGRAVAARARAFGMRIVYSQPRPVGAEVEAALGATRLELAELLATSDVVSIHCPLGPDTRRLIDERALSRMKPHAILVNTARGPIVDEAALGVALASGKLGAVGLDVFEREPAIPSALRDHPRAMILPHLGSATEGTRARMGESAATAIADCLAGRRPKHVVVA
jgi:glyoxylate reductase